MKKNLSDENLAEKAAGPLAGKWGEPQRLVSPPEGMRHRHLSWPKITRTPQGTLVLAYSAGIGHNMGGSGSAVSVSRDGGQTFSTPRLLKIFPEDDQRYLDCGNHALGIAEDGAVILLAMGFNSEKKLNTIFGYRSTDEGESWEPVDTSQLAENKTGSVYGHVFQMPGGRLGVTGHYREGSQFHEEGIWISFSDDGGRTWDPAAPVVLGQYNEPAIIHTHRGFIGLLRTRNSRDFYTMVVSQDGNEWKLKPNGLGLKDEELRYPSPFITQDLENPDRLWALKSARNEDISLYTADMSRVSDLLELEFEEVGTVITWGGQSSDHKDWTYPWMTYMGEGQWIFVFYSGKKRGRSDIYGLKLDLDSEKGQAVSGK